MLYDPTIRPVPPHPSPAALAHVLRNRYLWPVGFVFDYANCSTCAMGLAQRIWPREIENPHPYEVGRALGVSFWKASRIFMMREKGNFTPDGIAADLEALE